MSEGTDSASAGAVDVKKKIQVILPEELDRKLDAAAGRAGITKSRLIREILSATIEEIEKPD
jgi:predicted DNA-binding protein